MAQIRPLAEGYGSCFATDRITMKGKRVGYMYRQAPVDETDSGWRFLAGDESDTYVTDLDNHGMYDVNIVANLDPDIVPFLDAPVFSAFQRRDDSGPFEPVPAKPAE